MQALTWILFFISALILKKNSYAEYSVATGRAVPVYYTPCLE
jgi:hypothetical protein